MIKKEIALDEPDADGNTPLALALKSGHKGIFIFPKNFC